MPWCDDCAKFWNPPSLGESGQCPTCGRVLTAPVQAAAADSVPRTPWHFKLLLVALAIYLSYRAFQGVEWLTHHV
jgi:hypothetical protein